MEVVSNDKVAAAAGLSGAQLQRMLVTFLKEVFDGDPAGAVDQSGWDPPEVVRVSFKARQRCGFDLCCQMIKAAFAKQHPPIRNQPQRSSSSGPAGMVVKSPVHQAASTTPRSRLFGRPRSSPLLTSSSTKGLLAPDTAEIPAPERVAAAAPADSSRSPIPETQHPQDVFLGTDDDVDEGPEDRASPVLRGSSSSSGLLCPDSKKRRTIKNARAVAVPERRDVSEKYGKLELNTTTSAGGSFSDKGGLGIFGTALASSPPQLEALVEAEAAGDHSPSILTRKGSVVVPADRPQRRRSDLSLGEEHIVIKNKWGITVDPVTGSQLKRNAGLKQGSIFKFLRAKGAHTEDEPKPFGSREDEDVKRAIELSMQDVPKDNSFDVVPDAVGEAGFKYVDDRPVRGRAARMRLEASDCPDCRAFYKGQTNLTEAQLEELLRKCSKHRSKFGGGQQDEGSPVIRWRLELEEDGENDRTQYNGSPLKTRGHRVQRGLGNKGGRVDDADDDFLPS